MVQSGLTLEATGAQPAPRSGILRLRVHVGRPVKPHGTHSVGKFHSHGFEERYSDSVMSIHFASLLAKD
jgi:hypothetical protein